MQYWSQVPLDYEVVYVGQCDRSNIAEDRAKQVANFVPFCTHATAISQAGSQRLSRAMNFLKTRFHKGLFHLRRESERDFKADTFFRILWRELMTNRDKTKWVAFNPTPETPSTWGNRTWTTNTHQPDFLRDLRCNCATADINDESCRASVPVGGSGLAFQNMCKADPGRLELWRQRPPLPAA